MRRFLVILGVLFMAAGACAKGITKDVLKELQSSVNLKGPDSIIARAIQNNPVDSLALDKRLANQPKIFTYQMKKLPVTDQARSGRCWLFAGMNVLRRHMVDKYNLDNFEFSYNYLYFYDKLEKANLFLDSMIRLADKPVQDREVQFLLKNPCPDGGQWNMVVDLAAKYGVVPLYAMPETAQSHNSRAMNRIINRILRKATAQIRMARSKDEQEKIKMNALKEVYRVLVLSLGQPPKSFVWRYNPSKGKPSKPVRVTPEEFYRKYVGLRLEDFVYLTNAPVHPMMKVYQVRYDRDMVDRPNMTFVNIPIDKLLKITTKAIKNNIPVWFGADVTKYDVRKKGWLNIDALRIDKLFGVDLNMSKKDFLKYDDSVPNHAMVLVGVDIDKSGNPTKFLVENSWGKKYGDAGYWTMTTKWFKNYVYAVIVPKKLIPAKILKIFKQKPTVLQPWDPMYKATCMGDCR